MKPFFLDISSGYAYFRNYRGLSSANTNENNGSAAVNPESPPAGIGSQPNPGPSRKGCMFIDNVISWLFHQYKCFIF